MTKSEYYTIKGYLDLLEKAKPNGRYNHALRNKIMGLRANLAMDCWIGDSYEIEVKDLINKIYIICTGDSG